MPQGIYKRKSPVQEKLERMKKTILKDALSGEKSVKDLAYIYGVCPLSLSGFYKKNGIKKKRMYVKYIRGHYKSCIKELRDYIKENNISRNDIVQATLSLFRK